MWAERVMGIGPTLSAWKAEVLPLNYTRLQRTDDTYCFVTITLVLALVLALSLLYLWSLLCPLSSVL